VRVLLILLLAGTTFDTASIRVNTSGSEHSEINDPKGGRFTAVNATLSSIVLNAWNLRKFQVERLPGWAVTTRYDIHARFDPAEKMTEERFQEMLRGLLIERFAMKTHWVTREMPIYALVQTKGGARMVASTSVSAQPVINGGGGAGAKTLVFTKVGMKLLAFYLGNQVERLVVDQTGLDGEYDFRLTWAPDETAASTEASMFRALQEQLGLRLAARKGPVSVLVVDQVRPASPN
jgi:uncharacterized protein (TIGR03435 family)